MLMFRAIVKSLVVFFSILFFLWLLSKCDVIVIDERIEGMLDSVFSSIINVIIIIVKYIIRIIVCYMVR